MRAGPVPGAPQLPAPSGYAAVAAAAFAAIRQGNSGQQPQQVQGVGSVSLGLQYGEPQSQQGLHQGMGIKQCSAHHLRKDQIEDTEDSATLTGVRCKEPRSNGPCQMQAM
eukprot:scaffold210423_cov17-Tisochrysis_lutea.AAC.1